MLLGIVTEVREEQLKNALSPILVTLLGIVIEVKPEQLEKAERSILVTLLGKYIDIAVFNLLLLDTFVKSFYCSNNCLPSIS